MKQKKNKYIDINQNLRKLWSDHVFWTRDTIVALMDYKSDISTEPLVQRLFQNQSDIANYFSKYYSSKISLAIKNLLDEHIRIAADLIMAIKNKETNVEELAEKAIDNAKTIANSLNKINKKFGSKKELTNMLVKHVELLFEQIKDPNNVLLFDDAYDHILKLADQLTNGFM